MNKEYLSCLCLTARMRLLHPWSEHGGCRVTPESSIDLEVLMFLRMPNTRRISTDIEAAENIKLFDSLLPDYAWVSDTKKIDFLLWSID